MRAIIAGGRDYRLTSHHKREIKAILSLLKITEVVSGGCRGADIAGEQIAVSLGLIVTRFDADWVRHGKKAGPLRNIEMAEYADICILLPGGKGTLSMRNEAEKRELKVIEIK